MKNIYKDLHVNFSLPRKKTIENLLIYSKNLTVMGLNAGNFTKNILREEN